jgi:parallel beta-helix repeat protein
MIAASFVLTVALAAAAPAAPYRHTITIDGANDFNSQEIFPTTTVSYTAYVTWDDSNLYLGCSGPDIIFGGSTKWLLFYLDPDPGSGTGSSTGRPYNTQQPTFPAGFAAKYLWAWGVDELRRHFFQYSGTAWEEIANPIQEAASSTRFVEFGVPLSSIGNPAKIGIAACLVDEVASGEWTYGGMPSTAFTDGYDPDFAHSYVGDFSSARPPNDRVVIHVPGDFATISAAINASYSGDTLLIGAGTFTGSDNCSLTLGTKEIVIQGVHDQTILDCENTEEGIEITGGQTEALHITDLTIIRSVDYGIHISGSSARLGGCRLSQCEGGISLVDAGGKIEECEIYDNPGPGVSMYNSTTHILSCFIHGNTVEGSGGGIFCYSSNATIEGCTITDNTAQACGGGICLQSGTPLVANCEITRNEAWEYGGGLCLHGSTSTIQGCTVSRNSTTGYGAGIFNNVGSDPLITASIIWGNCGEYGSDDLYNWHTAYMRISCSDLDPGGTGPGSFPIQDGGLPNISTDPLFCDMGPCGGDTGDFTVSSSSPCVSQSCATLIGAHLAACTATPVAGITWGRLKALYR